MTRIELWCFVTYLLLQAVLPTRRLLRLLVPGGGRRDVMSDNSWHFSWTMRLQHCEAILQIQVYDLETDATLAVVLPPLMLTRSQVEYLHMKGHLEGLSAERGAEEQEGLV